MGNPDILYGQIREIFRSKLNVEVPSVETDIIGSGILDSLTFVDLLLHLEQEFGRKISLDTLEINDFRTIRSIAEFLLRPSGAEEMKSN